jgi:hypothetical protein
LLVDTEGLLTELVVHPANILEVVARPPSSRGFAVLPRRWVKRSFAWIDCYRRLSRDDEALTATSEAMIWAAVGTTMLRRLAKRGTS